MDLECQLKIKYFRREMACTREKAHLIQNLILNVRQLGPRKKVTQVAKGRAGAKTSIFLQSKPGASHGRLQTPGPPSN